MKTYEESLIYLNSFKNYEKEGFSGVTGEFNLEKIKKVLTSLGTPQNSFRSIHVAGTKGKGSTCTFTSSILTEAGYKVGLFTSPHLSDLSERIKINGEDIGKSAFVKAINSIGENLPPDALETFTYFEVLTLIAIIYFCQEKVDFAVFEAGLGGRCDATNVVEPQAVAITSVSYDHTEFLGKSLEKIASEKAGIIKRSSYCVVAPQQQVVQKVILDKCSQVAAESFFTENIKYSILSMTENGTTCNIETDNNSYPACKINLPGEFQVENLLVAIALCEKVLGGEIDLNNLKKGIEKAFIPARAEIIARNPMIVIDGAQNTASAQKLKESIEQIFKYDRLVLLMGFSRDKDIKGVCRVLEDLASEIIITKAVGQRAADPRIIRGYIKGKKTHITKNTKEALGTALRVASSRDLVLVAGSLYVAGEIRSMVQNIQR